LRLCEAVSRLANDNLPLMQLELSEPQDYADAAGSLPRETPHAPLSLKSPTELSLKLSNGVRFISDVLCIVSLASTESLTISSESKVDPESHLDLGDLICDTPVLSKLSLGMHSAALAMKLAVDLFPRLRRSALTNIVASHAGRDLTKPAWSLWTPKCSDASDILDCARLSRLSIYVDKGEESAWHLLTGQLLDGVEKLYVTFNSPSDPLKQLQNLLQSLRVQFRSQIRLPNLKEVYITLNCGDLRPVSASMVDDCRIWFTWVLQTREQNGRPLEHLHLSINGEGYVFKL
jgi:hypothetical protein